MNKETTLISVLSLIAIASGIDIMTDLTHGAPMQHIIKETMIVGIAIIAITYLIRGLRKQNREIMALKNALENTYPPKASAYILNARKKLSEVITQQFEDWKLTTSEREVGWLLLKGLSLKEIAAIRNTLEKTVRQQASAIYRKAELPGRHAFAAWFIEDLLG
ncbi:MAG: helix-turn-helix domain-containing protein [Gammaproteobacteria bacterium]|nr:helix-turn-helix domain-containing protein [Gammaproteobacteria bacterium]